MSSVVAWGTTTGPYCEAAPFHPSGDFPELPFGERSHEPNAPYALLREVLATLGYDREHAGTPAWNPLRGLVTPGQTVLLKPNFVLSRNDSGDTLFASITHPSILRALIDYVYLALEGRGRIIVADAPQMDCKWSELMAAQRLDTVRAFYRERFGFEVELYDLRNFELTDYRQPAFASNRTPLPGDPIGSVVINLGRKSHFYGLENQNFYGADYDRAETIRHHSGETQEYCVSRTVLSADVVICVPKMKVHKKVGVTLNLKGLVGINTNKNYLVHYTLGTPRTGGDQLPDGRPGFDRTVVKIQRLFADHALAGRSRVGEMAFDAARFVYKRLVKPLRSVSTDTAMQDAGNWHGNDSCWRMTADLAKILFFADADGNLRDERQRTLLCIVDGIVAGEGNGPLEPTARPIGCLVAGENPVAVDITTARLMGFDIRRIPQFSVAFGGAWDFGLRTPDEVVIRQVGGRETGGAAFFAPERRDRHFAFAPHPGWVGHVEV